MRFGLQKTSTRFFQVAFLGGLSDLFLGYVTSILCDQKVAWKKLVWENPLHDVILPVFSFWKRTVI